MILEGAVTGESILCLIYVINCSVGHTGQNVLVFSRQPCKSLELSEEVEEAQGARPPAQDRGNHHEDSICGGE